MSWQSYIDNLMGNGRMTSSAIFDHNGLEWAASRNFPVETNAIKQIISGLSDPSKVTSGVTVNNERYIFIRSDPGSYAIFKKGSSGLVAYKTSRALLIGLHDEKVKAEQVCTDLGNLADYLIKQGY